MKLTLTNQGGAPVLVGPPNGAWVTALEPGVPFTTSKGETVLILGDKPDVREQFAQAVLVIGEVARKLIDVLTHPEATPQAAPVEDVNVSVQNNGATAVRAILGDGVTDMQIAGGDSGECSAAGYVELRELGLVQADPNQHEAP